MGRTKLNKKCTIDGCDKKHHSHGYCISHVKRLRKYGDALGHPERVFRNRNRKSLNKKCSVVGCGRMHQARDFCSCHYVRFMKHGTPQENIPIKETKRVQKFCKLCNNPIYGSSRYCSYDCKHEAREERIKKCKYNLPKKIDIKPPTHFMHKYLAVQLVVPDNTFRQYTRRYK